MNITIIKKKSLLAKFLPATIMIFIIFSFKLETNGQICGSVSDFESLRRTNHTAYQEHLRIEKLTADYKKKLASNPNARLIDENGVITIPVVFHVLHKGETVGTGTNISDALIFNQVAIVNQAFGTINNNPAIPQVFRNVGGNPNFRFELACTDPNGYGTSGIVRKSSNINFQRFSENAKHTALGGDDAWPTDRFLNIWIVSNLDEDLIINRPLAYATYPEFLTTKPTEDGVVTKYNIVGENPNNLVGHTGGRTLIHEIGHWLNILHTFDYGCSGDGDLCEDTPRQVNATDPDVPCSQIQFPYLPNSCGNSNPNGIMYDNFMDYTNDQCGSRMFTKDQVTRMRATFQNGGPRRGFIDNYFKLYKAAQSCASALYFVQTPFCAANVNWTVTSPATAGFLFNNSHLAYVTIPNDANGELEITASWNNYTDSKKFMVGYGRENSTYNPNYYNSGNRQITNHSVNMTSYNNWTYGQVNFSEATGPAKNWRLGSSSSTTYISGSGNSFGVYLTQPYAFATIRAEVPTNCGDRTIEYSFLGGYLNMMYMLSPNPTSNALTISASAVGGDPNNRTTSSNTEAYDVQIFNSFNQLLKKEKVPKSNGTITIDVSQFPSNQFYTVKLIAVNDVQTKTFFKQ